MSRLDDPLRISTIAASMAIAADALTADVEVSVHRLRCRLYLASVGLSHVSIGAVEDERGSGGRGRVETSARRWVNERTKSRKLLLRFIHPDTIPSFLILLFVVFSLCAAVDIAIRGGDGSRIRVKGPVRRKLHSHRSLPS